MARPLRRALLALSVRLGVLVTEVERLPMPVIAEYIALLRGEELDNAKAQSGDVEQDLMRIFGKPKHG